MTRWREARGTQLKRQFENASLYVRDLGDEQAERFGRGLNYLFNDWVERFGLVKDCEVRIRKHTVKEMRSDARRRYEHDIGAAYALEFLSCHVEASYLPGGAGWGLHPLESAALSRRTRPAVIQGRDGGRRSSRESRRSLCLTFWMTAEARGGRLTVPAISDTKRGHVARSSSNALASRGSSVSKPSVNQP